MPPPTGHGPSIRRRHLMLGLPPLALGVTMPSHGAYGRELEFPRDHGAHTDHRTEWWYVTGQAFASRNSEQATAEAMALGEPDFGFQITFFRSRVDITQGMQSSFAAKQLLFAHAAVTDVKGRKLWHDQRMARAPGSPGTDLTTLSKRNTELELRGWALKRSPIANALDPDAPAGSLYHALIAARDFKLDLKCRTTQPLLLQGDEGWSRKGPERHQGSQYYSQPQLRADGVLSLEGKSFDIKGRAWLDHEWSEELLHPEAVGWDWVGMNLDDGSALTAFRVRNQDGRALWDGGSFRTAAFADRGRRYIFKRGDVVFRPIRSWKSPRTGATYPVEWIVRTPVDFYTVRALVEDQELDARRSAGAVYWEGLSELLDSNGQRVGRGYLEMTGYAQPLRM